jgi:hypothetical protein
MISSIRNFVVRHLDADRFTIVLFQILDIKSNYLPGIVHVLHGSIFGGGGSCVVYVVVVLPSTEIYSRGENTRLPENQLMVAYWGFAI